MSSPYRSTLRLSSIYAVANLARRGVHVFLMPFYTAILTVEEFGQLALINLTVSILSLILARPVVAGALDRFYYHPKYRRRNDLLLFNAAVFLAAVTAVGVGVYLLLAGPATQLLYGNRQLLPLVRQYGLVLLLQSIWGLLQTLVQLRELAVRYTVASLTAVVASAAVTLAGLLVFDWGIYAVGWGLVTQYAVSILMYLPVFLRTARFRLALGILREPLRFGYPLTPSDISQLVLRMGDRYVLRAYRPFGELGAYSFSYGIAEAAETVLVQPLILGVEPTIRKMEADPAEQKRFIRLAATSYYGLAVSIGLLISLFSRELAMLLGRNPAYWEFAPVIPIITLAFVQHALGVFLGWGLIMTNRPYHLSGTMVAGAAATIGLCVLLVPIWGAYGAAVGALLAVVFLNVLKMFYSAKYYGLRFELRRLAHVTVLGVGLYAASLLLPDMTLALLLPLKLLLVLAMPGLCLLTGAFSAAERQFLADVLRRFAARVGRLFGRHGDESR